MKASTPVERLPESALLPPAMMMGVRPLLEQWTDEGRTVAVWLPVRRTPKSAAIDYSFRHLDEAAYAVGSDEARRALYIASRKKSWPMKFHLLQAADEEPDEFADIYSPQAKSFVLCYLVGLH